jgi:hypothetical protein
VVAEKVAQDPRRDPQPAGDLLQGERGDGHPPTSDPTAGTVVLTGVAPTRIMGELMRKSEFLHQLRSQRLGN